MLNNKIIFRILIIFISINFMSCATTNEFIVKHEINDLVNKIINNSSIIQDFAKYYPEHFDDQTSILIILYKSEISSLLSKFNKIKGTLKFYEIHFDKYSFKQFKKYKRIPEEKNSQNYYVFLVSKDDEDGISFYFMIDKKNQYILFDIQEEREIFQNLLQDCTPK